MTFEEVVKKYGPAMKALQEIRDQRLYRADGFKTFDAFMQARYPEDIPLLAEWEALIAEHN